MKTYYTPELREFARELFNKGMSPADVTTTVNTKFNKQYTKQQMASMRSQFGLGPLQLKGIKRNKRKYKNKSPEENVKRNYRVTVDYPNGEMSQYVDQQTAMTIIQILIDM